MIKLDMLDSRLKSITTVQYNENLGELEAYF